MSDASRISRVELVDLVDDGMTDEEIASHTEAWLDRVRSTPGVVLPESAAEALEACERDGELWPT
jgi:hypothetical protein